MKLNGANLEYLRSKDVRAYELFKEVQTQVSQVEQQTNSNATGNPPTPGNLDQLVVSTGPSGEFQATIHDNAAFNRGVNYWLEHDTTPAFANPHVVDVGQSRNWSGYLGSQKLYWRAYKSYSTSGTSEPVYHGGSQTTAQPVQGGVAGRRSPSQGSGTGAPGVGLSGPGPVQQRNEQNSYNWKSQVRASGSTLGGGGFVGTPTGASTGASVGPAGPSGGGTGTSNQLFDTYANWTTANYPPANYPLNTTFTILDWNYVTYIVKVVAGVNKWVYESGTKQGAYSTLPTTGYNGAALGANDAGLRFEDNATYYRIWRYTGSGWTYAVGQLPGGDTSPAAQICLGNSVPPGWALCNGSTVTITKSDATTVSFTTPNPANLFFEGGSYTGSSVPAVAPTITGPANTGTATTGVTASTGGPSGTVVAGNGTNTAGSNAHTHTVTISDPGHAHTIGAITAGTNGTPAAIIFPLYVKL